MVEKHVISKQQLADLLMLTEGHFFELKSKSIAPAKLTKTVSAFANADGGELFVGILEENKEKKKKRTLDGFGDEEQANGHLQALEEIHPLGDHYLAEFLDPEDENTLILRLEIFKNQEIIYASDGSAYRRKGAQNIRVSGADAMRRLELDKGITSFEDSTISMEPDHIEESEVLSVFLENIFPNVDSINWLRKQRLVVSDLPTVASVVVFHEEPQAVLPKRTGVKIYRYKTSAKEGSRETLDSSPISIEGDAYNLIYDSVSKAKEIVEGIKSLDESGMHFVTYPDETIHEIITNAILHRDYSIASDIHIKIFDNRVEILSPGKFPGHVTEENILTEQVARNPKIVRLLNKFQNPPNKDIGEGLNTAFHAMKALKLKEPEIKQVGQSVIAYIRHEPLASPETMILEYITDNEEITNKIAREITGIGSENAIKNFFYKLRKAGYIERVPGKQGNQAAWRKTSRATSESASS